MSYAITDFHSHIFPGADHGSDSVNTSLTQLSYIKKAGAARVVGTPHFYPTRDNTDTFLRRRNSSVLELAKNINGDFPEIMLGAEVFVCKGMDSMEGLETLCVVGTKCILLEMPLSEWDNDLIETVYNIKNSGFNPVMAHVDRYPPENVEKLFDIGMIAQINASSLLKVFRKHRIMKWVEEGLIYALGSDIHGRDEKCAAGFTKALHILGSYGSEIMRKTDELLKGAKILLPLN